MAMSDCVKCWDTPCSYGYDYADWSIGRRITLAMAVLGVSAQELQKISIPQEHPLFAERYADKQEHNKRQKKLVDDLIKKKNG